MSRKLPNDGISYVNVPFVGGIVIERISQEIATSDFVLLAMTPL
jgi:hypothetical protein